MEKFTQLTTLTILGEKLSDLCAQEEKPCTLLDPTTQKYHSVSTPFAKILNLKNKTLIGKNFRTLVLEKLKLDTELNKTHVQQIEAINQQIIIQKKKLIINRAMLTNYLGLIKIERLVKTPIFNSKKQLIAIVTYADDLTNYYDILSLMHIYRSYYPEDEVILKFLKHFSLDKYFYELPTCIEVRALLALYFEKIHHKKIALLEKHIQKPNDYTAQLAKKLKIISVEDVLYLLNTQHVKKD